jgi:hypothetical protein
MISSVQMYNLLGCAVIKKDIEAAGKRDDDLLLLAKRMPAPLFPARDIVDPVDPGDLEGNMPLLLNECKIAPRVNDLGKFYEGGVVDGWRYV